MALLCAGIAPAGGLSAQAVPGPVFGAEVEGDSVLLRFEVPEGWSLYAPVLPGPASDGTPEAAAFPGPSSPAGRPLRLFHGGELLTVATWPEPVVRNTVLGPAQVHEAGRHVGWIRLGKPAVGEIEVEWAICSQDLCVPGRTRVAF